MENEETIKSLSIEQEKKEREEKAVRFWGKIDDAVNRVLQRMESEVPESGNFAPILEVFECPELTPREEEYVGKCGILVFKMPEDVVSDPMKRYVEAAVYTPSGQYKADQVVASGTKQEIREKMTETSFVLKLMHVYRELREILMY